MGEEAKTMPAGQQVDVRITIRYGYRSFYGYSVEFVTGGKLRSGFEQSSMDLGALTENIIACSRSFGDHPAYNVIPYREKPRHILPWLFNAGRSYSIMPPDELIGQVRNRLERLHP